MAGPALPPDAHGHPAADGPAHVRRARRPRLRRVVPLQAAALGEALVARRRREGVREVRAGDARAACDAEQAASRLHGPQSQEGSVEDTLEVRSRHTTKLLEGGPRPTTTNLQELGQNSAHGVSALGQR